MDRNLDFPNRHAERPDQQQQRRTEDIGGKEDQADVEKEHRHVLLLIVEQKGEGQPRPARASVVTRSEEGVLHVSPDGHGYIVYGNRDSVYVPMQRIRRAKQVVEIQVPESWKNAEDEGLHMTHATEGRQDVIDIYQKRS